MVPFTKPFHASTCWHKLKYLVFIKWKTLFQKWMDFRTFKNVEVCFQPILSHFWKKWQDQWNKSELLEIYRKVVVLMGWKSLVDKAAFWYPLLMQKPTNSLTTSFCQSLSFKGRFSLLCFDEIEDLPIEGAIK